MSGGSFDYLCLKPGRGELGSADQYRRMADSLSERGHHGAAALTYVLASQLDQAMRLATMLAPVHRAEEWCVSGDIGPEGVAEAADVLATAALSFFDKRV